jgi:hypothetical protein
VVLYTIEISMEGNKVHFCCPLLPLEILVRGEEQQGIALGSIVVEVDTKVAISL